MLDHEISSYRLLEYCANFKFSCISFGIFRQICNDCRFWIINLLAACRRYFDWYFNSVQANFSFKRPYVLRDNTAQKMKFSIKNFFSTRKEALVWKGLRRLINWLRLLFWKSTILLSNILFDLVILLIHQNIHRIIWNNRNKYNICFSSVISFYLTIPIDFTNDQNAYSRLHLHIHHQNMHQK